MGARYMLGIDQGTTGSTAIVFDQTGRTVSRAYREFAQSYPQPGWVEHDAAEIWRVTLEVARRAVASLPDGARSVAGIGVTNQRETTVVWDRATGRPVCPAIVWQCRRTAEMCEELKTAGVADMIRAKTGLVLDAYFSATKLAWILANVPGARQNAEAGRLAFGTIDTWLIWNLTGGKAHVIDCSNASRTMLFNLNTLSWDDELIKLFRIPRSLLPEVRPSSAVRGQTEPSLFDGVAIPIAGSIGDQQAATFGQACFRSGQAKITYGTGGFLLMPVGPEPIFSQHGLLTTIAWGLGGGVTYALEGSIFSAGSCVQWLRDGLGIIRTAAESEDLARSVDDTGGVYLVPAFTGLGAPYWDPYARGAITGLTRGTTRAHLARAALEAIAFQAKDVLDLMQSESGVNLTTIRADGGAAANDLLLQFQADLLDLPVERPYTVETTALGAAYVAGLAVGYWESTDDIAANWGREHLFTPSMRGEVRATKYAGWLSAVGRARS